MLELTLIMGTTAVVGTTHQFYEAKIFTTDLEILGNKGGRYSHKYFLYFALYGDDFTYMVI
jgi:hypothetical protein